MVNQTSARLTRQQIAQFITDPRSVRSYESMQGDLGTIYDVVNNGPFLITESDANLGSARQIAVTTNELVATDGGAGSTYTLGLADTAVTAGDYGDASHMVKITFDAKGRATGAQAYLLNSDNVTEGSTNLFFTNARARNALSAGTGISYDSGTGAIALDTANNRNVDHSSVSVSAGVGLTGGGDLTTTRTLALATSGVTAGTYANPTSITVDQYGRITNIS